MTFGITTTQESDRDLRSRLEQITGDCRKSIASCAEDFADPDTAELREAWLAFGSMADSISGELPPRNVSRIEEEIATSICRVQQRSVTRRLTLVAAGLMSTIGAGAVWLQKHSEQEHVTQRGVPAVPETHESSTAIGWNQTAKSEPQLVAESVFITSVASTSINDDVDPGEWIDDIDIELAVIGEDLAVLQAWWRISCTGSDIDTLREQVESLSQNLSQEL